MSILSVIYNDIFPFLLVLFILVLVHELGHYFSARRHGIKIEVFSIGFGKEIIGWTDKNKTRWKLSIIPLGGYVKMFGDQNDALNINKLNILSNKEIKDSFFSKSVLQRIEIVAAGPFANYIFAILIMSIIFTITGKPVIINDPVIGGFHENSLAKTSGLLKYDRIVSINDINIREFSEINTIFQKTTDEVVKIIIIRSNELISEEFLILPNNNYNQYNERISLGIIPIKYFVSQNIFCSIFESIKYSINISIDMLHGILNIILGKSSSNELSGPIGIVQISGMIFSRDWLAFFNFIALLSINIGLINLLPIPMLDGGYLFFYFIELVRGKALSRKIQDISFKIGFTLIILIFIYVTSNDIIRLLG